VDFTERVLAEWHSGETRDVHQEMMNLTSKIVTKALFSAEIDRSAQEVDAAFNIAIQEIGIRFRRAVPIPDFIPLPGNIRYNRSVKRLDDVIYGIIRQRKEQPDGDDLLSMMLKAQDEDGSRMTDRQLRDEAVTLFLAGHETTAIALTWTFYLLSQHPEVEEKLHEELRTVLQGRSPKSEDMRKLPFTEMVINESMRLYPPAYAFGRETIRETRLNGITLAKGTTVFMSQWVMHRDPRFFNSPDEFRPERWSGDLAKQLPRFAYFPFGGGPRVCIGNSFATMEAILLLATIAQKFRLTLMPGQRIEPFPAITLRPRFGMKMKLEAER
jgi:cytochrome P450